MAEQNAHDEHLLHQLFEQVSLHIETRLEHLSLNTAEKISNLAGGIASGVSVFVFGVLVLFFFSMGFAWWLGDFFQSRAGGFAVAGLIFVPIGWLFYRWIGGFVRDKIIEKVLDDEQGNNPTH